MKLNLKLQVILKKYPLLGFVIPPSVFNIPTPTPLIPGLNNRITQNYCQTSSGGKFDVINCSLNPILDRFQGFFFALITAMAVILLIWAGIEYIQAGGNQDAVKKARQRIINIVIGIILLVATYAVINLIIAGANYLHP